MIRLPHQHPDRYESFVIDFRALEPLIGRVNRVNGFRLRPGLKISHFCVCDDLPVWLQNARMLNANEAPRVSIEQPAMGSVVERENLVQGTFANVGSANAIQVFVLSPDDYWYRQRAPEIGSGRWRLKAFFGGADRGAGEEYQIAALAMAPEVSENRVKTLPAARGKTFVKVTRRS